MSTPNVRPGQNTNQRRSQRIILSIPLRVAGKQPSGTAFTEHTTTLIVNAHGALIQLRESVQQGQSLDIKHMSTGEELACTVIEVTLGETGVPEVGVEFIMPNPRFWRVSFPPADWTSRSPEAKRFAPNAVASPKPSKTPVEKK